MIYNYEIKKINGEEVLYLYFDLDSEFAKLNFKESINKIEDIVKKFIEENKIAFTGLSVAIVVGGILAYNVALSSPINKEEILDNNPTITESFNVSLIIFITLSFFIPKSNNVVGIKNNIVA